MQIYAKVMAITPLETREKKDKSGTYTYADVTLQPFDLKAQPGTHAQYNPLTGEKYEKADAMKMDAIRDKAEELVAAGWKVGDVVIADIDCHITQYGHNETVIRSITKYNPTNTPTL